jgi:uncharacterized membrane protein YhhN
LGVPDLSDPLALFAIAVVVALLGVEIRRRLLLVVAKPIATLSLIGVALGGPRTLTVGVVTVGLALSAIGDTALLVKNRAGFLIGLLTFLVAHLLYAAAFLLGGAGPLWTPLVGVVVFGAASGWLVRRMWTGLTPGLRVPLIIYTAACTAMTAAALSTLAGSWADKASVAAAAGAVLFYLSDANLAWNDFVEPYEHGQTVTLSLYWAGQLGIASAVRWSAG